MIKRLYIDTSVFGGYFDIEFDTVTRPFFTRVFKSSIRILISDILEFEIYNAPAFVQDFYESIPAELIERVELTEEANALAEKYIAEKVVGRISLADCQHIALATINKADVLVSWNFKHIVNLERIKGYNAINYRQGYQMIEIRTPREIFNYENTTE
ncbi:MAG: PIN domain-containing protein [Clostridia bacterium]|jgi:predicted nucleic acid-binding protein|nr:PIN domain-containing protein [Bacteroidales bacterium]MDD4176718.1 PIN domain-containing protein [Bacteroidales bacterium]MDD4742090.1 PIN domain-containing protein [Bacteroidales bacterium]NCB45301.1 PIN domain-containing protein [Clostridia bacterium]